MTFGADVLTSLCRRVLNRVATQQISVATTNNHLDKPTNETNKQYINMWSSHTKSAIWLILEKASRVVSGLFVTAAVARYLGPESYGTLTVVLGAVAVFAAGASMGAEQINTAELSTRNPSDSMAFLSSAITARIIWATFCLASFLMLLSIAPTSNNYLYIMAASLIPMSAFSIIANKIQADGDFAKYSQIGCVSILISAVVKIFGIFIKSQITYFIAAAVIESVIAISMFTWWVLKKNQLPLKNLLPDWSVSREYFRLCLPTAISAVLVAIYLRLELFIVTSLLDKKAAGLWAGIMMFITPWSMVAASILPIANRHLSQYGVGMADYETKIVHLIRFMLIVSILAAFLNVVAVSFVVPIILGDEYVEITGPLWIASVALIPLFMGSVQEIWIAHQRTTSIVIKKVIIGLPISTGSLYLFVNKFELYGAAFSMVFSTFSTAIVMNLLYDKNFIRLQLNAIGIGRVK